MTQLTHERLLQVIHYSPETGVFTWKIKPRAKAIEGNIAGSSGREGRVHIAVDTKRYKAHRLAWFYMTGEWPNVIDHVNGDPSDNRWGNLRDATTSLNLANSRRRTDNTSGYKGVSLEPRTGRWVAYLTKDQRRKYIGSFKTPKEAHDAYCRTAKAAFGEFARVA
jgi:hypothetical protein